MYQKQASTWRLVVLYYNSNILRERVTCNAAQQNMFERQRMQHMQQLVLPCLSVVCICRQAHFAVYWRMWCLILYTQVFLTQHFTRRFFSLYSCKQFDECESWVGKAVNDYFPNPFIVRTSGYGHDLSVCATTVHRIISFMETFNENSGLVPFSAGSASENVNILYAMYAV